MSLSRISAMITMEDLLILMIVFFVGKIIESWIVEYIKARLAKTRRLK